MTQLSDDNRMIHDIYMIHIIIIKLHYGTTIIITKHIRPFAYDTLQYYARAPGKICISYSQKKGESIVFFQLCTGEIRNVSGVCPPPDRRTRRGLGSFQNADPP